MRMMTAMPSFSTSWVQQTVTVGGDTADINTVSFPFIYTIYGSAPEPTVSTSTSIGSTTTSAALGSTHASLSTYKPAEGGPISTSLATSMPGAISSAASSSPTAASLPSQLSPSHSPHTSRLWYTGIPLILGFLLVVPGLYLWRRYGRASFDRTASAIHGVFEKTGALVFGSTRWDRWRETRRINRQRKVDSISSDVESMRQMLLRRAREAGMTRDSRGRRSWSQSSKARDGEDAGTDSSVSGAGSVKAAHEMTSKGVWV